MYELDSYLEAQEDFPVELLTLETEKGLAKHLKTDILSKKIWYTVENAHTNKPVVLDLKDVKSIIQLNKRGKKPSLNSYIGEDEAPANEMNVGTVDMSLVEKKKGNNNKRHRKPNNQRSNNQRRSQGRNPKKQDAKA